MVGSAQRWRVPERKMPGKAIVAAEKFELYRYVIYADNPHESAASPAGRVTN